MSDRLSEQSSYRPRCGKPGCKEAQFALGLCRIHYYRGYAREYAVRNKLRMAASQKLYQLTDKGRASRRKSRLYVRVLRFLNRASITEISRAFPTLAPETLSLIESIRPVKWARLADSLTSDDYTTLRSPDTSPKHLRYIKVR